MNFICVNPVGSAFAKALSKSLNEQGSITKRVSVQRGQQLQAQGDFIRTKRGNLIRRKTPRKFFYVTPRTLNKVEQFNAFKANNVSCPAFTTDRNSIGELDSKTVFARTLINSTSGRGIVEFDVETTPNPPAAPLYTAYIPKKAEYRLHVFNGKIIDAQQKKKKRDFDADNRDTRVRNLANGYVYTRDGIVLPDGIDGLAISAVAAVGYLYGAVDIIYNEKRNQCYVLEVNSRPGLMGTTLSKYVNALKEYFE